MLLFTSVNFALEGKKIILSHAVNGGAAAVKRLRWLTSAWFHAGMNLNNQLLQLIGLRFADDNYEIDFDDYLTCIVRLENMFSTLKHTKINLFIRDSSKNQHLWFYNICPCWMFLICHDSDQSYNNFVGFFLYFLFV